MSAHELLPCPFCGSTVSLKHYSGDYGYTSSAVGICCKACDVGFMEQAEEWKQGIGTYSVREQAEAKVIAKWNTRKGVQCQES